MNSIRVEDLAAVMIEHFAPRVGRRPKDIELKIIGPRPAEKLYEELSTEEEMSRTYDAGRFLVVRPVTFRHDEPQVLSYNELGHIQKVNQVYNSRIEKPFTREEVADYLLRNGLIPES